MTNPNRTPGLRGRLPVKPEGERFAIAYISDYAAAPLPAPKYPVDVSGGIGAESWGMAGNGPDPTCTTHPDGVGDCGFAAEVHYGMAKAACRGIHETPEPSNQLVADYLRYDHGRDEGVVLADVLLYWYKAGKILAFAPVDHSTTKSIDAAMQQFKGCYVGVDLTPDAEDQFSEGKKWTTGTGNRPSPDLGHCILKVKSTGKGLDGYVTWGALQEATASWSKAAIQEAWVVVMHEDEIDPQALAALKADINALHGTGGA